MTIVAVQQLMCCPQMTAYLMLNKHTSMMCAWYEAPLHKHAPTLATYDWSAVSKLPADSCLMIINFGPLEREA